MIVTQTRYNGVRTRILNAAAATILGAVLGGCTPDGNVRPASGASENGSASNCDIGRIVRPRIHSIGTSRILTYEPKRKVNAGTSDEEVVRPHIDIVVQGNDLYVKSCVRLRTVVTGSIHADLGENGEIKDYEVMSSADGSDGAASNAVVIRLLPRYVERLKSGDEVEVLIIIERLDPATISIDREKLAFAKRRFTIFTVQDYRKEVQINRVKVHNLQVFPLPHTESEKLFGPVVADNFFAVRLSVRNDQDVDKLITSGMIVGSGHVLVEAKDGSPSFTVPVDLSPQSLEQVYTMVSDQESVQPRTRVFRGLEFLGALATALAAALTGAGDFTKATGLVTGVATPELRKAWVDRWPQYQRNVVAFSMQDVLKVPAHSVANQKYIFFSKNKIEGIVSDPNLFLEFEEDLNRSNFEGAFGSDVPDQPEPPKAAVITVGLDSLDVPFENVFSAESRTEQEQLADAAVELRALQHTLGDIRSAWIGHASDRFRAGLDFSALERARTSFVAALTGLASAQGTAQESLSGVDSARKTAADGVNTLREMVKLATDAAAVIATRGAILIPDDINAMNVPNAKSHFDEVKAQLEAFAGTMGVTDTWREALTESKDAIGSGGDAVSDKLTNFTRALPTSDKAKAILSEVQEQHAALERNVEHHADLATTLDMIPTDTSSGLPNAMILTLGTLKRHSDTIRKSLGVIETEMRPFDEHARAGRLPLKTNGIESVRQHIVNITEPVGKANSAQDSLLAEMQNSQNDQKTAIEDAQGKLQMFRTMFSSELTNVGDKLGEIVNEWPKIAKPFEEAHAALKDATALLDTAVERVENTSTVTASPAAVGLLLDDVRLLSDIADALVPARIASDLIDHPQYGLAALDRYERDIETARKAVTRGGDTTAYEAQITAVRDAIATGRSAVDFYGHAASMAAEAGGASQNEATGDTPIPSGTLLTALMAYASLAVEPYRDEDARQSRAHLRARFVTPLIDAHAGLSIVKSLPQPADAGAGATPGND